MMKPHPQNTTPSPAYTVRVKKVNKSTGTAKGMCIRSGAVQGLNECDGQVPCKRLSSAAQVMVKCCRGTHASKQRAHAIVRAVSRDLSLPPDAQPRSARVSGGQGSSIAGLTTAEIPLDYRRGSGAKSAVEVEQKHHLHMCHTVKSFYRSVPVHDETAPTQIITPSHNKTTPTNHHTKPHPRNLSHRIT